jgi:hypothetical protein
MASPSVEKYAATWWRDGFYIRVPLPLRVFRLPQITTDLNASELRDALAIEYLCGGILDDVALRNRRKIG